MTGLDEDGVAEDGADEDGVDEDGVGDDGVDEDGVDEVVVWVTGKPLATSCSLTAPCADHMHCQGPEGGATCVCTPGHVPDTNATCGQCPLTSDQVGKGELTASVIRMQG